jgi:SARP family transcriptional regulator, regulator of embCAB operon
MRYDILGPLRILYGGNEFALSAPKTEILLTALLIRANKIVPANLLLTELWGEDPPRRASAGLHVYVSQLRKFLGQIGGVRDAIVTRSPGYMLRIAHTELDVHLFQDRMGEGRRQLVAGRSAEAVTAFEAALDLWHGPALGGLASGPILAGFATWLEECRMECLELLVGSRLAAGQHRETVSTLYSLIAEHPLREEFYRLLMLALYRSGRQADALRVYQQARGVVIDELGLEPCRGLRELHQAILVEDNTLTFCS